MSGQGCKQGVAAVVDAALVARGLRDALSGSKTALTGDEMKTGLQQLATEVRAARKTRKPTQPELRLAKKEKFFSRPTSRKMA
jgi:hypothetical protein